MGRINWNNYKFHCSGLPTLMTKSRVKDQLSETAKSYLRELWISEVYKRNKLFTNKFCDKGLLVEQDSLELVTKILNKGFLAKNKEFLENEYICGTPDIRKPFLGDIKSSWDIWTFASVDQKKAISDYYWQLFGYMWLEKQKRSKLIYSLVNTPIEIVANEKQRLQYSMDVEKNEAEIDLNYEFEDISQKTRIKVFNFKFEKEKIDEVIKTVEMAREYLKSLKL